MCKRTRVRELVCSCARVRALQFLAPPLFCEQQAALGRDGGRRLDHPHLQRHAERHRRRGQVPSPHTHHQLQYTHHHLPPPPGLAIAMGSRIPTRAGVFAQECTCAMHQEAAAEEIRAILAAPYSIQPIQITPPHLQSYLCLCSYSSLFLFFMLPFSRRRCLWRQLSF